MRRRNPERHARLRERNFGAKRDWIIRLPCEVTGEESDRIHPAHVRARGMGGCGGSSKDLVPLRWDVHRSFDEDPEARFLERWRRTKASVRAAAPRYERRWQLERAAFLGDRELDF